MTKLITLLSIVFLCFSLQAQDVSQFFTNANTFFEKHVTDGKIDYKAAKQSPLLDRFIRHISNVNLDRLDDTTRKAYLINAYNILVIKQVVDNYPLSSVQETGDFFTKSINVIGGKKWSLTKFEKEVILGKNPDPRLHFVLVCGAIGCPPITNFAYTPENLENQLNAQTKSGLNDPAFISLEGNQLNISKIFEWYATDFGANKGERIDFINQFRNRPVSDNVRFKYVDYDWTINEHGESIGVSANLGANASRYVVSSTIAKGTAEIKLFNNLFTQRFEDTSQRNNFFTSTFSALYGVNNRFNAGIEFKYRRVSNTTFPSSALTVFGNGEDDADVFSTRTRITGIGPKIRWAPTAALPNFSIQSTVQFPVGDFLQGGGPDNEPFIDWDGVFWNTQFFNDIAIGTRFSLFTELDIFLEDLGNSEEGRSNRFSTPATLIFSYFPNPKTTIYTLGNYAPIFVQDFDYFYQIGLGFKYQFSPVFELELLISDFTTKNTAVNNGQAATYNLGLRYNIQ